MNVKKWKCRTIAIENLLKEKLMSKIDLAKKIGVSKQYIYEITNNKQAIGHKTIKKISNALDVDFNEIFELR